ncbi:MAG: hypothetical protein IPH69_03725 [Bacteroidales bacterium]|nr:hypothetical protein [Bacteroidales bacterium]
MGQPAGSAGQVLQSNGTGAPVWSTPTYPGLLGLVGQILRSNGTNNIYSTSTFADTYAASSILYSSGANNVTGLTTGNDGVLVTDAGGVPSISSTLPDAVQYNITKLGTITNGTWNGSILGLAYGGTNTDLSSGSAVGDLLTGTATGFTRLADVATGNVLISGGAGAPPTYGKVGLTTHVSGVLEALNGGTGYDNTYTNGQLLIGNSSGTLTRNPLTGTANQVIVTNGSGTITLSTPQDIHTETTPEFVSTKLSGLAALSGVYTDINKVLTSTPPSSGTIGYWSRNDLLGILTPSNAGDDVTTTGDILLRQQGQSPQQAY